MVGPQKALIVKGKESQHQVMLSVRAMLLLLLLKMFPQGSSCYAKAQIKENDMTEEERNQTGKFSDEYQDELVKSFGIFIAVLLVVGAFFWHMGA